MSALEAVLPRADFHETHISVKELQHEMSGLSSDQEMKKLGISSDFELKRYHAVAEVAGHGVAMREIKRNVAAYEKEFIQDIPISDPHPYYHIHGKLHSEEIKDPLFAIESQIDGREREGKTLYGFQRFQELVTQDTDREEMVVWYSPAGVAGTEPPFSDIYFDSGRLYFAYKNHSNQSQHIDIKVDEQHFPIKELLNWMNYCSGGIPPRDDLTTSQTGYYYLQHPMNLQIPHEEFSRMLYDFAEKHKDHVVYTSQRDSRNAHTYTLHDIFSSIYDHASLQRQDQVVEAYPQEQELTQQQIQEMYLRPIALQMQKNGGQITLYGCSTTSVLSKSDSSGIMYSGAGDMFSSWGRLTSSEGLAFVKSISEKKWSYHKGDCRACPAKDVDVGPCEVCKTCEKRIDKKEQNQREFIQLMQQLGVENVRIV